MTHKTLLCSRRKWGKRRSRWAASTFITYQFSIHFYEDIITIYISSCINILSLGTLGSTTMYFDYIASEIVVLWEKLRISFIFNNVTPDNVKIYE